MKAERRHQLQNNELAKQLETLPEKLQRHASKVVLGVTVVLLCVFVFRYRQNAAIQRGNALASATATAQFGPRHLRSLDAQFVPPDQLASYRNSFTADINNAIDTILRESEGDDGAALRAQALVAKGDLNWTLANLAPLPGAATQPALALKKPEEYLKVAEAAYRDVIGSYSTHIMAWVSAQFGLAAIAENRQDWAAAKVAYEAVMNDKSVPLGFQEQARRALIILNEIQGPVLLSAYPATAPSSQPTAGATTQPNAIPASSSDPATQPATAPTR